MKKYYWVIGIGLVIILAVVIYDRYFLGKAFEEIRNSPAEFAEITPLTPVSEESQEVSLMAVGDIMLSRDVATKIKEHQDYKYPFLKTAGLLKTADLTIGNLENPITPGRSIQTNEMVFRADPEVVEGLTSAGFDLLSLANNHILNFGTKGLNDTFRYLKGAKIDFIGAGEKDSDAYQPLIREVKGIKFAFLGYSYTDSPLVAFMDLTKMEQAVRQAKEKTDFVVVTIHAGSEYQFFPNNQQQTFAHLAIESGAALVVGHHPHVVQTLEKYQEGYIIYSLGNFIFDQMWSQETREGLMTSIVFKKEGIKQMEFYPVIIENFAQPRVAKENERESILARLKVNWENQDFYLIGENQE